MSVGGAPATGSGGSDRSSGELVVTIGGTPCTVSIEPTEPGYQLHAAVPVATRAGIAADLLRAAELGAPGDVVFGRTSEALTATRRMVHPTSAELHDAAHDLARRLRSLQRTFGMLAAGEPEADEVLAAMPPSFPAPADVLADGRYMTWAATVRQGLWSGTDAGAEAPTEWLEAGTQVLLLDRVGDWALVMTPDDRRRFTDARTLVRVPQEEIGQ